MEVCKCFLFFFFRWISDDVSLENRVQLESLQLNISTPSVFLKQRNFKAY
jgi:hypothetical protein